VLIWKKGNYTQYWRSTVVQKGTSIGYQPEASITIYLYISINQPLLSFDLTINCLLARVFSTLSSAWLHMLLNSPNARIWICLLYGMELIIPKGTPLAQLELFQKRMLKQILTSSSLFDVFLYIYGHIFCQWSCSNYAQVDSWFYCRHCFCSQFIVLHI
jgi:hypothetical protein